MKARKDYYAGKKQMLGTTYVYLHNKIGELGPIPLVAGNIFDSKSSTSAYEDIAERIQAYFGFEL